MPFGRLYLFSLLGISLAAVLDACTSYGTHLLWPFAETRIAWNVVSVFDPLLTILISVPVILAITRHRPGVAIVSLFVCATYLGLGSIQHARALRLVEEYASVHSLRADRLLVKPTFGNIVLWRGMAQTRDAIHVAGLRPALFGEGRVYPGERAKRFDADDYAALPSDSRLHRDLDRFRFFSDDLLAHSTVDVDRIGDARYAMRPDRLKPIWSVSFDANSPNRPVDLNTDREMSKEDRDQFLRMLMGR